MALHTIGIKSTSYWSLFGLTIQDFFSIFWAFLFYYQPGVDRAAVLTWIINNIFMGSQSACSIFALFVSHKCFEWGGLLFYSSLYCLEDYLSEGSWLKKHLVNARLDTTPRFWNANEKNAEFHKGLQWKSLIFIVKFHLCVTVVQLIISLLNMSIVMKQWFVLGPISIPVSIQWDWIVNADTTRADPNTIPDWLTVTWQCVAGSFIAETGFYWAHRLQHSTWLYKYHKLHHSYNYSSVWATFYVTLIDSTLTDLIPAGLPVAIFGMHTYTILMYTLPLLVNALQVHCGYANHKLFPFINLNLSCFLPFATDVERTHEIHHLANNCNYGGAYFFWDRLCGTWINPDTFYANKDKMGVVPGDNNVINGNNNGKKID